MKAGIIFYLCVVCVLLICSIFIYRHRKKECEQIVIIEHDYIFLFFLAEYVQIGKYMGDPMIYMTTN
jgi:hypothetical protein